MAQYVWVPQRFSFNAAVGIHAPTQRLTYTVPAGSQARLRYMYTLISWDGAAAFDSVGAYILNGGAGSPELFGLSNAVATGGTQALVVGCELLFTAGQIISAYTKSGVAAAIVRITFIVDELV